MAEVIECVINISEGRDPEFLDTLSAVLRECPESYLLSCSSDRDHNRSVLTLAGSPCGVVEAAWIACREAVSSLDIRRHHGVHPRIGVVDVVPFVPVRETDMESCIKSARKLGARIGAGLGVPVYLYGRAASDPDRADLARIRKGELSGLAGRILRDQPDFGPPRIHPSAGASAVGARDILIAYNIDLDSRDLVLARKIARAVRESGGGIPTVKALGLFLESRGRVQVSMNLTDYRVAPIRQVFTRVQELARAENTDIAQSEIIGHLPRAALDERDCGFLRLRDFDPGETYIEDCLEKRINGKQ